MPWRGKINAARKKTSGLKLLFLPKDALKWSHSYLTQRRTSNKKIIEKFKRHRLLLSATYFAFESAVLWGFSDEQTTLLSVSNTPTDLDSYPANPSSHYMHAFLSAVSKMYFLPIYLRYIISRTSFKITSTRNTTEFCKVFLSQYKKSSSF